MQRHVLLAICEGSSFDLITQTVLSYCNPTPQKLIWALKMVPIHVLDLLLLCFKHHPILFAHEHQLPKQCPSQQTAPQLSSHPRAMENYRLFLVQLSSYMAPANPGLLLSTSSITTPSSLVHGATCTKIYVLVSCVCVKYHDFPFLLF